MKTRIFALFLALLSLLSLASCQKGSPAWLYENALEKLEEANGMAANVRTMYTFNAGDHLESYDENVTVKYSGDKIGLLSDEYEVLYIDGVMYMTKGDTKAKKTITKEEFNAKYGGNVLVTPRLPQIPKDAYKDVLLKQSGDSRFFTVKLDPASVQDYVDSVYDVLVPNPDESVADIQFLNVVITATFDQKDTMTKLHIKLEVRERVADYFVMDITIDTYFSFIDFGITPDIVIPSDADSYVSLDGLDE